jgi:hypothetical protein
VTTTTEVLKSTLGLVSYGNDDDSKLNNGKIKIAYNLPSKRGLYESGVCLYKIYMKEAVHGDMDWIKLTQNTVQLLPFPDTATISQFS